MRLRLPAGTSATRLEDGRALLEEGHIRMAIGPLGPGLGAALDGLRDGADEAALAASVQRAEDESALLKMHMLLRRLEGSGWIERTALDEHGEPVCTLRPIGHRIPPPPRPPAHPHLSRFAVLHADGGELVAESPRSPHRVVVHQPARLVEPGGDVLALLAQARIVVDDEDDGLGHWNLVDLLFHTRSRAGTNVGGYGGTYHREGHEEPLPAVKPVTGPTVPLPVPEDVLDMPIGRALEDRASIRAHDDERPIDAARLGAFLHRCARVRQVFNDGHQQLSSRPYPSGGAVYELELYPLVHRCAGIEPALYRYDPQGHRLERVAEPGPKLTLLLEYGQRTAAMDSPPQVLVLIAARFARAMWKYESMAYALVLKDVGVLYQTMYLVATAMGLAPCSLGGGNSAAFAEAAGLDPYAETSVGEFVLGSAPSPPAARTP
jgi:SagB-type dehydrogenase family enzyme